MIRIDDAGYPVLIGTAFLDEASALLAPGRCYLVSDSGVAGAGWTDRLARSLGPRLLGSRIVAAGEDSKSFRQLEALLDAMIDAGVGRSDHVLALGGGMAIDLAGFAAAVLKRGCGFVPVPTTLLAQADSAIGGKTAVNTRQGKNLIGAFHRPSAVLIDVSTLATLPERELRAGYAEIVKYGLIGDPAFFGWCEAKGEALLAGDGEARLHAVAASVRAKIGHVAGDERDLAGKRALLNFGHTFGHAVEAETGLRHGEAVAIGMCLAMRYSADLGLCPTPDAERVEAHLRSVGLPTRLPDVEAEALVRSMSHDKKNAGGELRLVLSRGIGEAFLAGAEPDAVRAFLERELASAGPLSV